MEIFQYFAIVFQLTFGTLVLVKFGNAVHHTDVKHHEFCYTDPECGPETWEGMCKTGTQQSPIHIPCSDDKTFKPAELKFDKDYLTENYHHFYAQNTGHTVQFELAPNTSNLASNLTIFGGKLESGYNFAQLHFHWGRDSTDGSEHTLCGEKFPLELHLVHYKETYASLMEAMRSGDRKAVLVVGMVFQIGAHSKMLKEVIHVLPKLRTPGEVMEFKRTLAIINFYPEDRRFARYLGSLTTPTCDESVVWTFFIEPLEVSESQMKKFREISNAMGNSDLNFRPVQPLNGRHVGFYDGSATTYTDGTQVIASVTDLAKDSIVVG